MEYSQKISERLWNQPDKGELESHREETFIDDIIQKNHIEQELLSHLEGIQTVLCKQNRESATAGTAVKHGLEDRTSVV